MTTPEIPRDTPYLRAYGGLLRGVLRWQDLDSVWARLQERADDGWYVYVVGEAPPSTPATPAEFERFLATTRQLLQDEHEEDYCGIVYADDFDEPCFVKIYHPRNLGVVCGYSEAPPLPGWTLSRVPPDDLQQASPSAGKRRPWWRRLLG